MNLAAARGWGDATTRDHHLDVPHHTPDEEKGCSYRVRPRMVAGKPWKDRLVRLARFVRKDDGWRLEVVSDEPSVKGAAA